MQLNRLSLIFIIVSTAFSSNYARAQELRRIHYGTTASPANLPIWTAKDAGLFAKKGLNVELVQIRGGALITMGIMSGQLQFSGCPIGQALLIEPIGLCLLVDLAILQSSIDPSQSGCADESQKAASKRQDQQRRRRQVTCFGRRSPGNGFQGNSGSRRRGIDNVAAVAADQIIGREVRAAVPTVHASLGKITLETGFLPAC